MPWLALTLLAILGVGLLEPTWVSWYITPLVALAGAGLLWRAGKSWRGAAIGHLLWAVGDAGWALNQVAARVPDFSWADLFFIGGYLGWYSTLIRLPGREWPRLSLWFYLPALLAGVALLTRAPEVSVMVYVPLSLILLFLAMFRTEIAVRGEATEGRMLWIVGVFISTLCANFVAWLAGAQDYRGGSLEFVFVLGYAFMAVGGYLEGRSQQEGKVRPLGLWVQGFSLAGLLTAWGMVISGLNGYIQDESVWSVAASLGGYLTFVAALGLSAADRNRRVQAETRLRDWAKLLEQLYQVAPANQTVSPQSILADVLVALQPFFPTLAGIGLRNDFKMRVGQKTDFRHTIALTHDEETKVTLYFTQPLEDRESLEALTPILTERLRQTLALMEWRTQAITDPLTGLLNRRGLERQTPKLIDLAKRTGKPITVAMLDLDYFKRVNDTYGHDNGDRVLQSLANVLRRHLRAEDLAVRWGGEEFALLLYGAGLKDAQMVLERIRAELRAMRVEPIAWNLTLSAGITGGHVPVSGAVLEDWLLQADWALLQAKETGRDQVNVVQARKLTDTQVT